MTAQDTRRRATALRDASSLTTSPRETERIRVGTSGLREGRQQRMDTITQDREAARHREATQGRKALRVPPPRPASGRAPALVRPSPARPAPNRSAPGRSAAAQSAAQSRVRLAERAGYLAGTAKPRMRFALLVLVLLGGGLVCLLVINTTLGATSFRISQLQSSNADLQTQEQVLQQQIAAELSPALIARRAYQLGMRVEQNGTILDLRTHRIDKLATQPGATVPLGSGP